MKIEVDQSGRIAATHLSTVLAFSNGLSYSIFISSQTKRDIIVNLRRNYKGTVFYLQLFSVLIFILVKKHITKIQSMYIDEEYIGNEGEIKGYLIDICAKNKIKIDPDIIHFIHIGKHSKAHLLAIGSLRKGKASKELSYKEVLQYFLPNKKDRGPYSR